MLDLGAHYGESIEDFRKILDDPKTWDIISIEASPLNYKELQKKVSEIKHHFKSIKTINAFAYINNSDMKFYEYIDAPHHAGSTFSKYKFIFNSKKKKSYRNLRHNIINIPSVNIIELYKEKINIYNKILIKLDVEGAEYHIFPELLKVIDPVKTPKIYCEFHNIKVNTSQDVDKKIIKQLKSIGIEFVSWR